MRLAAEILTIYGLYAFSAAVLILRYGAKDRGPTLIVAWLMPALLLIAVMHSAFRLLFSRYPKLGPPPPGLEDAEKYVEKHRQEMFGGEPIETHFASDWARLYARTLEEEAQRVQILAKRALAYA